MQYSRKFIEQVENHNIPIIDSDFDSLEIGQDFESGFYITEIPDFYNDALYSQ